MPRRGENIYKRKDGRWEGRYLKNGNDPGMKKRYRSVYGKSYLEVKKKLTAAKSDQEMLPLAGKSYSMEEWLDIWLYQYAKFNVKESTFSIYYGIIQRHINPDLGAFYLNRITLYDLQLFFNEKLKNGRLDGRGGLAIKTVKDIHTILSTALKQAVVNNLIHKNPCSLVKIPTEKFTDIRVLSVKEQKILVEGIKDSLQPVAHAIMLSLYTGLRIGEVCALKWENIDLDTGILTVSSTLQRIRDFSPDSDSKTQLITGTPKSNSSLREIPLSLGMIHYIGNIRNLQDKKSVYFLTGIGGKPIDPRVLQIHFKKLVDKLGIKYVSFHTLRHTFATRAIEVGMDIKSISEILGHADVSVTMKRYVHSLIEHKRNQMQKIDTMM